MNSAMLIVGAAGAFVLIIACLRASEQTKDSGWGGLFILILGAIVALLLFAH